MLIPVDGHVHLHPQFAVGPFLDAAAKNFDEPCGILLLTETPREGAFSRLRAHRPDGETAGETGNSWRIRASAEPERLTAIHQIHGRIEVVAGRQLATHEGLEVLALATRSQFEEDIPIRTLVRRVRNAGAVPVIPWGFGKWTFGRGRVLAAEIAVPEGPLFLGDNGGRPAGWAAPRAFAAAAARGIGVLAGSDPLNLPWEISRPGSFGFRLPLDAESATLAADLRQLLLTPGEWPVPYGGRVSSSAFLRNQLRLRTMSLGTGESRQ